MAVKKYNFDFAIDTKGMATIKINKAGIVFSRETIRLLGSPAKVMIGIDSKSGMLCVRSFDASITGKAFDFCTNETKMKWIRIKSEPIMQRIVEIAQIDLEQTTTFIGNYDEENSMFLVELKQHNN